MSDRPTPVTPTDSLLSLVLDELQGLRADLAGGRGGAGSPAPSEPATKKAPAKKPSSTRKRADVDGR